MPNARAVLTLAAGNPVYWEMAINLARSFLWWHMKSDIRFFIATDLSEKLPTDLSEVQIVRVPPNKLGKGFSAKLHLDELAPASKTLFIDADCLVVGNLEFVFSRFVGRPVSVVGGSISSGEWFGDVGDICLRFGVSALPKFNGGIYYVEPGALASQTYTKARALEPDYDDFGLRRLRGRPNDELLMAISMSLQGFEAIPEDGTIMSDPHVCPEELELSVLRGRSRMASTVQPSGEDQLSNSRRFDHPAIVHFLGDYTSGWRYRAEAKKLQLVTRDGWPVTLAEGFVRATFSSRQHAVEVGKNLARPLYHATFGPRPVPRSPRL
jgi:hypothetical protein